jgi:hypothetical protein
MLDIELSERLRHRGKFRRDPTFAVAAHSERVGVDRTSLISASKPGSRSAQSGAISTS